MFVTFFTILSELLKLLNYRDTRACILDPCIQEFSNFEFSLALTVCPDRERTNTDQEKARFHHFFRSPVSVTGIGTVMVSKTEQVQEQG